MRGGRECIRIIIDAAAGLSDYKVLVGHKAHYVFAFLPLGNIPCSLVT